MGIRLVGQAEDFVGFNKTFPLFLTLTVFHRLVDPGDQRTSQGHTEVIGGKGITAHGVDDLTVDIQDGRSRVGQ